MMPGFRGMRPRQVQQMMKRAGIDVKDIEDVTEVIIKTPSKRYVFDAPQVTMMTVQGQQTYQVIGEPHIEEGSADEEHETEEVAIPEDDIELVASTANVSREDAKRALEECDGNPAEAILKLTEQMG